jgi:hypothetical protein
VVGLDSSLDFISHGVNFGCGVWLVIKTLVAYRIRFLKPSGPMKTHDFPMTQQRVINTRQWQHHIPSGSYGLLIDIADMYRPLLQKAKIATFSADSVSYRH